MAIVLGIMFTQLFGLNLATPHLWRYVFLVSFGLSAFQLFTSAAIVESPAFLGRQRRIEEQKRSAKRLWGIMAPVSSGKSLRHTWFQSFELLGPNSRGAPPARGR